MLVGINGVSGFCAGIDTVEYFRLGFQIVTAALEVFVPVRILNDHPDFGIDRLCGANDEIACGLFHKLDAKLRPAFVPLGFDAGLALAVGEKEIV